MEKANRALYVAEENAAHIAELSAQLKSRTSAIALDGTVDGDKTLFGAITTFCPTAVIAVFGGESGKLEFCGDTVAEGNSPLVAVLPEGKGELALSAARVGARAVVMGAKRSR